MVDYSSTDDGLRWWAVHAPSKPYIVMGTESLTFAEADAWVDRVASYLADMGVRPGERIGVVGPNSMEWAIASLGILRVGGVHAGLSERCVASELRTLISSTDTRVVLAADTHIDRMREAFGIDPDRTLLSLSDVKALRHGQAVRYERPDIDAAEVAAIIYSSGSTGQPKGVAFSMHSLVSLIQEWALVEPAMGHEARIVGILPLSPMGGFINQILRPSVVGGTVFLLPKFDERETLRLLVEEKCNSLMAPPLIFQRVSALPEFKRADLSMLTYAIIGGAPVPSDEFEKWFAQGASLRETYGSTEAGGHIMVTPLHECRGDFVGCGRGNMFRKIKVARADGSRCNQGEDGEILVRGAGVMEGYWNNPEATAEVLRDGWLHTGDLGCVDETGVLRVTDRIKEVIITGGFNVGPTEVEFVLLELDSIEEAAVLAVPDPVYGEGIGAIVWAVKPISIEDIISHCRRNLTNYKVPRYVLVVDEKLPRSEQGKYSKVEMRKKYGDALAKATRPTERVSV